MSTNPNNTSQLPTETRDSQRANSILEGKRPQKASKKLLKHVAKGDATSKFAQVAHDIDEPDFDNQDSEIMYLQLEIAPLMKELQTLKDKKSVLNEVKFRVDDVQGQIDAINNQFNKDLSIKKSVVKNVNVEIGETHEKIGMAADVFSYNKQVEEIDFQLKSYKDQAEKDLAEIADWQKLNDDLDSVFNIENEEKKVNDQNLYKVKMDLAHHPEVVGEYGIEIEDKTTKVANQDHHIEQMRNQAKHLDEELKTVQRGGVTTDAVLDEAYEQVESAYEQKEAEQLILDSTAKDSNSMRFRIKEVAMANENLQQVLVRQFEYQQNIDLLIREAQEEIDLQQRTRDLDLMLTNYTMQTWQKKEELIREDAPEMMAQLNGEVQIIEDKELFKEIADTKTAITVFEHYIANYKLEIVERERTEREIHNMLEINRKMVKDLRELPERIEASSFEVRSIEKEIIELRKVLDSLENSEIFVKVHEVQVRLDTQANTLTEMTTLFSQLSIKLTELEEVMIGIEKDLEDREREQHQNEHEEEDQKHIYEMYYQKLQVKIDAHDEIESQVNKLKRDVSGDEEEIHYMEQYEEELDGLIKEARENLSEWTNTEYWKLRSQAEASLKKLCMLYPREWQCETVTIKEHKCCRRKYASGQEPEGYYEHVSEVHHDEDHTIINTFDDDFNLDNTIREKRDSEKMKRDEITSSRKQRNRFGQSGMSQIEEENSEMGEDHPQEAFKDAASMLGKPNLHDLSKVDPAIRKALLKKKKEAKPVNSMMEIYHCLLAGKQVLAIISDYEILHGYGQFMQMLKSDNNCHEAMFGLARINYVQQRYEIAEKLLMKAYKIKNDLTYRVWLGYTYYHMYRICTPENEKRAKYLKYAVQHLERCQTDKELGYFATFCLLYISLACAKDNGLKDVPVNATTAYIQLIKIQFSGKDDYEFKLAQAIVTLQQSEDKGVNAIHDLIDEDPGRSDAYLALINFHLKASESHDALVIAEEAYHHRDKFEYFHEQMLSTLQYAKALAQNQEFPQVREVLLTQYYESANYPVVLYYYGKYNLFNEYIIPALGALQECMRVSFQYRRAKCAFLLAKGFSHKDHHLTSHYAEMYNAEVDQVFKMGPVKKVILQVEISTIELRIQQGIKEKKFVATQFNSSPHGMNSLVSPNAKLEGQVTDKPIETEEIILSVHKIKDPMHQNLYKATALYQFKAEFKTANTLFLQLDQKYPKEIAVKLHNIKFLTHALKTKNVLQNRKNTPFQEALALISFVRTQEVSVDKWVEAHLYAAKLIFECSKCETDANQKSDLQIKAIKTLLQLRNTMPPIDTSAADEKFPDLCRRYLDHTLQHVDYQFEGVSQDNNKSQMLSDDKDEELHSAQDENGQTLFFAKSKFVTQQIKNCPMAVVMMSDVSEHHPDNHDLIQFGLVQADLSHEAVEHSLAKQWKQPPKATQNEDKYYRSSTPLTAVIQYFEHTRKAQQPGYHMDIHPDGITDFGFTVNSNVSYLYYIAKFCYHAGMFIDLAISSLYMYLSMMTYYKEWDPAFKAKRLRALTLLGMIMVTCAHDLTPAEKEQVTKEIMMIAGPLEEMKKKSDAEMKTNCRHHTESHIVMKTYAMFTKLKEIMEQQKAQGQ